MKKLSPIIAKGNTRFTKEWLYLLDENIVSQAYSTYRLLNQLTARKFSTKKEIFSRVKKGKGVIDDGFLTIDKVIDVAREANMAECHFYRCFRQIYDVSPYQYVMKKHLQLAEKLLKENKKTLTTISKHCGFAEVFSFSKSFRSYSTFSPSEFRRMLLP